MMVRIVNKFINPAVKVAMCPIASLHMQKFQAVIMGPFRTNTWSEVWMSSPHTKMP